MSRQTFANMAEEKQFEIASKGGKAAHAMGVAHEFTPEEARIAGRKGGKKILQTRGREYLSQLGSLGAKARNKNQALKRAAKEAANG
jgi:general stress protein YciG